MTTSQDLKQRHDTPLLPISRRFRPEHCAVTNGFTDQVFGITSSDSDSHKEPEASGWFRCFGPRTATVLPGSERRFGW
jgi:hypothetical protein